MSQSPYWLWFSVIIHFISLGKEIKIESTTTSFCATDWGFWGLDVPYLDYVEACLRVSEVKAFETDVLF